MQKPLDLNQVSDPEPDVAVIVGRPGDYADHPTTAALIIEISDTSLSYDTTVKMSLYAAGGITDYWVLDVTGRRLIVHRDPQPDATQRFGHGYSQVTIHAETDAVAPLATPSGCVRVAELLP